VTTGKMNCSTRCSLVGTPRATLRGLLVDCRLVRKDGTDNEDSSTRQEGTDGQDSSARKGYTVQDQ
jgi:hypothetical protein